MDSKAERRIQELHLTLPTPAKPMAKYKMTVLVGNMLYVSGHGPAKITDKTPLVGKVGGDLTLEQGQESARAVGLNILATVPNDARIAGQGETPRQDARHGQQHDGFQGSSTRSSTASPS